MYMKTFFIFFLSIILFSHSAYGQNWDINTLDRINSIDGKFVRNFSKTTSKTTPYIVVGIPSMMALYGIINKDIKLQEDALYLGTSVIEAISISYGAKHIIKRKRPYERYPNKIEAQEYPKSSSFPSSHTASAFSLATSLSIKYPKWYIIAPSAAWACSVGFARMNEGVHYPSDVFAGAIIGAGCAIVNLYINKQLKKYLLPQKKKQINY